MKKESKTKAFIKNYKILYIQLQKEFIFSSRFDWSESENVYEINGMEFEHHQNEQVKCEMSF